MAFGTFGQGPNVGRNWSGRVRLEFSGRKSESRLKPGWSGRVFGRVSGRPEADLKGGSGGGGAPPANVKTPLLNSPRVPDLDPAVLDPKPIVSERLPG